MDQLPELPELNIELDGVNYKDTINRDLDIDVTNMEQELVSQGKQHYKYGRLAAHASIRAERLKGELENLAAHLDAEKRMKAREDQALDPKLKFTEAMYENMVKGDTRYRKKWDDMLKAKELSEILKVVEKAFHNRIESLKALNSNTKRTNS